tara:strand:- start:91803 stop:92165 length:363 start_codon:yes stop_codon:yes gene_type:complete
MNSKNPNTNSFEEFKEEHFEEMDRLSKLLAKYKSDRIYYEHQRKPVRAMIAMEKKKNGVKAYNQQVLEAEADERYLQVLEAIRTSHRMETEIYYKLNNLQLRFEKWRTDSSNFRSAINLR